MAFVLDASASLPWCFEDEATASSEALLRRVAAGEQVVVPAHWPAEVLNALLRGKRRRRVTDAIIRRFLLDLASFRIRVSPGLRPDEFSRLLALAERHGLGVWDAAYLDLAKESGVSLATGDAVLARGAVAEGVPTL
jgi:predicted nucleic acid-binding protein